MQYEDDQITQKEACVDECLRNRVFIIIKDLQDKDRSDGHGKSAKDLPVFILPDPEGCFITKDQYQEDINKGLACRKGIWQMEAMPDIRQHVHDETQPQDQHQDSFSDPLLHADLFIHKE